MEDAIDICEVAARALRGAGIDAQARLLSAVDGKDGVVVRLMPSVTRRTYMDGRRQLDCRVQVVAKSLDEYGAMDLCERAARALCSEVLASDNGSYEVVGLAEQDGDVERLAVGTDRRHVWAVRVVAKIIRR